MCSLYYYFYSEFCKIELYIYVYDPFGLSFYIWCKVGFQFHFFACACPHVPASFGEETVHSPLGGLGALTENQLRGIWQFILDSQFCSTDRFLCPSAGTTQPCYHYSFVISAQTGECESSIFVLFQDCFGYFGTLAFQA